MRTARRGVDYIDRNFAPPPVVLSNPVRKNSSLQKNKRDKLEKTLYLNLEKKLILPEYLGGKFAPPIEILSNTVVKHTPHQRGYA